MVYVSSSPSRLAFVTLLVLGSVACASGMPLPKTAINSPGGELFNGYTKPNVKCFSCHNGDGSGANGPDLRERVPKLTDAAILNTIDSGRGYMPAYKDQLTGDEKLQLVTWLRSTFGASTSH